jgi:hypothetical protein
MNEHPAEAIARLIAFVEQFEPGQEIDELTGLTTEDVEAVIARAEQMKDMVQIPYLDLNRS